MPGNAAAIFRKSAFKKCGKGNVCKHCMNSCHVTLYAQRRTHDHQPLSIVTLILMNFHISMTLASFIMQRYDLSIAVDHMSNPNQNIRFDYLN